MSPGLSRKQLDRMHRFWIMHLGILAAGIIAATLVSVFWVVPQLYQHLGIFLGTLILYLLTAYIVVPNLWFIYERYVVIKTHPGRTQTHAGIPSDPLNVALIGRKKKLVRSMIRAGWVPADSITLRSSFKMAESVLLRHPYQAAPMSVLYLLGRRQDLAFERETGKSPAQRHHVRLWRTRRLPGRGYLWMGAASFDKNAGISHLTGQITHHIDGDVDKERDRLMRDLHKVHRLRRVSIIKNQQLDKKGKNAGGDAYQTDGSLHVGILA